MFVSPVGMYGHRKSNALIAVNWNMGETCNHAHYCCCCCCCFLLLREYVDAVTNAQMDDRSYVHVFIICHFVAFSSNGLPDN